MGNRCLGANSLSVLNIALASVNSDAMRLLKADTHTNGYLSALSNMASAISTTQIPTPTETPNAYRMLRNLSYSE